jgi:putative transposase
VTVVGKEVSLPWKDLSPMQQRKAFIDAYLRKEHSVSELCRRFGISRKTAYKWIDRFLAGCELVDRSRRPHTSPRAIAAALEDAIVEARKERPNWGPKKLRAALLWPIRVRFCRR